MPLDRSDNWLTETLDLVRTSRLRDLYKWKKKTEDELALRIQLRGGKNTAVSYHDEDEPINRLRDGLQILKVEIDRRSRRKSRALYAQTDVRKPSLEIDTKHLRVQIDGAWHELTQKATDMLAVLFQANGDWVGDKVIGGRPDKIRALMPEPVKKLIETHRSKGYRIPSLRT